MQATVPISVLVEEDLDEAVVLRVCEYVEFPVSTVYEKQGKNYILKRLLKYNRAARFSPWLVVIDLDRDASCAPDFIRDVLPNPAGGMCFRVVVRAIEAWLLVMQNIWPLFCEYRELSSHRIQRQNSILSSVWLIWYGSIVAGRPSKMILCHVKEVGVQKGQVMWEG